MHPHAAIEIGAEHQCAGPERGPGPVLVQIVRAVAAARIACSSTGGSGKVDIETRLSSFRASRSHTSFGQSAPSVAHAFVADDQQVAIEQRHHGVGEAGERRMRIPVRHQLRPADDRRCRE